MCPLLSAHALKQQNPFRRGKHRILYCYSGRWKPVSILPGSHPAFPLPDKSKNRFINIEMGHLNANPPNNNKLLSTKQTQGTEWNDYWTYFWSLNDKMALWKGIEKNRWYCTDYLRLIRLWRHCLAIRTTMQERKDRNCLFTREYLFVKCWKMLLNPSKDVAWQVENKFWLMLSINLELYSTPKTRI